jgi:hypothetical protein
MPFLQKSAPGPTGEIGAAELEQDSRRGQGGQGRIEQRLIRSREICFYRFAGGKPVMITIPPSPPMVTS